MPAMSASERSRVRGGLQWGRGWRQGSQFRSCGTSSSGRGPDRSGGVHMEDVKAESMGLGDGLDEECA